MKRIEKLEKIIVGTLLESGFRENYFDDCRCCITADMFTDKVCRRVYGIVSEMNAKGMTETDPKSIVDTYGDKVLDILPDMLELVVDYSFVHLKMEHNEKEFRKASAWGVTPKYTYVTFQDYVSAFLKLYENEKGKEPDGATSAAA